VCPGARLRVPRMVEFTAMASPSAATADIPRGSSARSRATPRAASRAADELKPEVTLGGSEKYARRPRQRQPSGSRPAPGMTYFIEVVSEPCCVPGLTAPGALPHQTIPARAECRFLISDTVPEEDDTSCPC
jgi:hypothetical protein